MAVYEQLLLFSVASLLLLIHFSVILRRLAAVGTQYTRCEYTEMCQLQCSLLQAI